MHDHKKLYAISVSIYHIADLFCGRNFVKIDSGGEKFHESQSSIPVKVANV